MWGKIISNLAAQSCIQMLYNNTRKNWSRECAKQKKILQKQKTHAVANACQKQE